jgi:hypothetical protein
MHSEATTSGTLLHITKLGADWATPFSAKRAIPFCRFREVPDLLRLCSAL